MFSTVFFTALFLIVLGGFLWFVDELFFGCKHEYGEDVVEKGDLYKTEENYPYRRIKMGTYFVKSCKKCGRLETFKCQ